MLIPDGSFGVRSCASFDMGQAWWRRLSTSGEPCRGQTQNVPPHRLWGGTERVEELRAQEHLADSTGGEARLDGVRDLLEREHVGNRQRELA